MADTRGLFAVIKYALICSAGHEFDVWFSKSSDFDIQASKGLVSCPDCGRVDVEKSIMAPNISTSRKKADITAQQDKAQALMRDVADKIRKNIETHCCDVGDNFAQEARAMHYGEKPERGIYGQATPRDASELIEEGIQVAPLPDALRPRDKHKLN